MQKLSMKYGGGKRASKTNKENRSKKNTQRAGPMLMSGRLSNLRIESLEFNCLKNLFRRFSIPHITSHSPNRSPCT